MDKNQLILKLREFKCLVKECRDVGLTEVEIIEALGIKPIKLGKKTRDILRAIQQKQVEATATAVAEKFFGGSDRYRSAYHHLKKLEEAGYLYDLG